MKKIILSIVVIGLLGGCSEQTHKPKSTGITTCSGCRSIEELTIDGCEYYIYESGRKYGITHKGNCSNPIHKCKCDEI